MNTDGISEDELKGASIQVNLIQENKSAQLSGDRSFEMDSSEIYMLAEIVF